MSCNLCSFEVEVVGSACQGKERPRVASAVLESSRPMRTSCIGSGRASSTKETTARPHMTMTTAGRTMAVAVCAVEKSRIRLQRNLRRSAKGMRQ